MDTAERCRRSRLARWGNRTPEERFWEKVERWCESCWRFERFGYQGAHFSMAPMADPANGCWLWRGAGKNGYGHLTLDGKSITAHRMSWLMAHKPETIPPKMDICHSCDVRLCVRPSHLWLGTRGDNLRDMAAKGRGHRQGQGRPRPVRIIRTACIHGHPWPENKNRFGQCIPCKRRMNREHMRRKHGYQGRIV